MSNYNTRNNNCSVSGGKPVNESVQQLAREHYENFPVASVFLPDDKREDIRRLYAYARTVDDLGDEAEGDRMRKLDAWERDLRRCFGETPKHEVLKSVQDTIRTHDLPPEPFLRLIEANRRDQRVTRYETWDALLDYCTYSANPCGRLYLMVFGYRDEQLFSRSDYTCTALQLTNFWQDVGIDLEKDRIYIPQELLDEYDISPSHLFRWREKREYPDRFLMVMDELVRRTTSFFARGVDLAGAVHSRLRFDLLLFTLGGTALLKQLKAERYPVFDKRVKLQGLNRMKIFPKALWYVVSGTYDGLKREIVIN